MKRSEDFKPMQRALLGWYRRHRRDLPWRRTRDPYAIWVSEILLQQTQVAAVVPYFERFLTAFPTVQALADASIDAVLRVWAGLGYYARGRNLHAAARTIVEAHGGRIPDTVENLIRLPGIGRSTAGAIAAIAYGKDEPVLDGNVQRVLARVFRIRQNLAETRTRDRLWDLARRIIPPGRAGDFNQALMDLGSGVCTPRAPDCPACPLRDPCQARRHGEQNRIPRKTKPKPMPHCDIAVAVITRSGRILIDRRQPDGLLGGLWEFPGGKQQPGESLEQCLKREVREEVGVNVAVGEKIAAVKHSFSHFRITLHAYRCRLISGRPRPLACTAVKWVRPDELDHYPFPKANHRIIPLLTAQNQSAGKGIERPIESKRKHQVPFGSPGAFRRGKKPKMNSKAKRNT